MAKGRKAPNSSNKIQSDGGLPVSPMTAVIFAVIFILFVLFLHILNKIVQAAF